MEPLRAQSRISKYAARRLTSRENKSDTYAWHVTSAFEGCSMKRQIDKNCRAAFLLIELLAIVTMLGIIAAIIIPRVAVSSDTAKAKHNLHNKATINSAVVRWYVDKGAWPAENL